MSKASLPNQDKNGLLGETRVQDVFLELEYAAGDARAWFETEFGMGEVSFHKGQMVRARLGGARGQTALLRLLAVSDGRYGIEACAVAPSPPLITSVSQLLELQDSRKSEWNELCAGAPPLSSVLRLTASGSEVRDTARGIQRVMLVLIDGRRTLMQVLEESSFDPVEALRVVTKAVEENLVQFAQQPNSLFPLQSGADASGMSTFASPAPVPHLNPAMVAGIAGPPSWRHATLVGIGHSPAKDSEPAGGLAPSPIIELGHGGTASSRSGMPQVSASGSLVKTVIQGFGIGRRPSSNRALDSIAHRSAPNESLSGLADAKPDAAQHVGSLLASSPIMDIANEATGKVQEPAAAELAPLSASFPVGGVLSKPDGQRRYIDRYEILLRIGRGGTGTVYLSRLSSADVGFRRLFALKLLRSHLSTDTQAAKIFLEEARTAGYLHHANVVPVYDAGFHGKQPYLVMEYVEGCNFRQLMRGLPSRAPYLLLPVMIDALAGLHAAHALLDESGAELQLVHGDVSPENLLVGVDGVCRVTDFGIARKSSSLVSATTRGKPGYVAPEQTAGRTFDHRADIFSMGVVLWGALTGRKLFTGATLDEIFEQLRNMPIPTPSSLGAQSYPALDQLILRALAREPKDRFDSAEAMLSALSKVAMDHDGLASAKEIAAWVKEAAGTELAQRRLAILDASRSEESTPVDGERNHSGEPPRALSREDPSDDSSASIDGNTDRGAAESASGNPSTIDSHTEAQGNNLTGSSFPPASSVDVGSLFYGKERVFAPPPSMATEKSSAASGPPRLSSRLRWVLAVLTVVLSILVTYLAIRGKSRTSQVEPNHTTAAIS